jgi:hypothetical protein
MVCKKIREFRKAKKKGQITDDHRPIGEGVGLIDTVDGADWSDSMLMLMERLDELRQFTIDEYVADQSRKKMEREIRAAAEGLRHIQRELKSSIYETLMLMNDVRRSLRLIEVAEQECSIRLDKAPDVRRQFELGRRKRTDEEKRSRFIND